MNENQKVIDRIDDAPTIDDKAGAIESLVWNHCRSPENLVYCFVMSDHLGRVTQEDTLRGAPDPKKLSEKELMYDDEKLEVRWINDKPQYFLQGRPLEDVEAYEDSLFATGTYLSSLCYRYEATHDPSVLRQAHLVFEALYKVYQLGLEEQPGWIPKPYGFQCSKQSSMDNQCPYYQGLIRYYKIATDVDRQKIKQVLTDQMDYWIRNRYKMHTSYFGIWVDFASDEHYPGHWPLAFLPLCDMVWKLTGDETYQNEFQWLLDGTKVERGKDPNYLLTKIRCFHRWYYEYGALLEQGTQPRWKWLDGLAYQIQAIEMEAAGPNEWLGYTLDMRHHKYIWLTPRRQDDVSEVRRALMELKVKDFLYAWPKGYGFSPTLAFRSQALYMMKVAQWLEVFWKGRMMGHW